MSDLLTKPESISRTGRWGATWKIAILLFLVSAFTYLYQKHTFADSNSTNRLALCLVLIEDGSVIIDRYHQFSIDLCYRDGHYYCDKAPGVSFLALPFVAVAYHVLHSTGRTDRLTDFAPNRTLEPNNTFKILVVAGTIVVSLLCAVGISVMFLFLRMLGSTRALAVFGALLLAFGTPYSLYATTMFGHSLAGAFLLAGLALGWFLLRKEEDRSNFSRTANSFGWMATGLILAYSVWIEYTAAVPACLIGILFLAEMRHRNDSLRSVFGKVGLLAAGAAPIAVGFMVYNTIAFGGPLKLGYLFSPNFPKMNEGVYGIKLPSSVVLMTSLFSPKNGVLLYSPVLILSPLLAIHNIRRKRFSGLNLICILIPLYYWLLNASYSYPSWRHLVAGLPFLVLPIVLAWESLGRWRREIVSCAVFLGFLICFFALCVPLSVEWFCHPVKIAFIVDMFFRMNIRNIFFYFGMNPLLSIAVLIFVWTFFGLLIRRQIVCGEPDN